MDFDPERQIDQMRDQMARAFGKRPDGQEHRVWIDHAALRRLDPGDHAWKMELGYSGLSELDATDKRLPAPLRVILDPSDDLRSWALQVGPPLVAALVGALVAGWYTAGVAFLPGALAGFWGAYFPLGLALEKLAEGRPPHRPAWWTPRGRIHAALDVLEAEAWVLGHDGRLIENLPSFSRLASWHHELGEALTAAERRRRDAKALVEELEDVRSRLKEQGADRALDTAKAVARQEKVLMKRITALREQVQARRDAVAEGLGTLRDRVRLERLRGQALAMGGQAADDTPHRLGAELELDLTDLQQAIGELRATMAEEEQRYRAMNEVTAL